jgi:hypothetical protein
MIKTFVRKKISVNIFTGIRKIKTRRTKIQRRFEDSQHIIYFLKKLNYIQFFQLQNNKIFGKLLVNNKLLAIFILCLYKYPQFFFLIINLFIYGTTKERNHIFFK